MTPLQKQQLLDAGRADLVEAYEIPQSGHAGVMPTGNIVDRRDGLARGDGTPSP